MNPFKGAHWRPVSGAPPPRVRAPQDGDPPPPEDGSLVLVSCVVVWEAVAVAPLADR